MVSNVIKSWGSRMGTKASLLGFALFLLTSLASGQAQQSPVAPAGQPLTASKDATPSKAPVGEFKGPTGDYTVSPEDLLDIKVMDVPEVSPAPTGSVPMDS